MRGFLRLALLSGTAAVLAWLVSATWAPFVAEPRDYLVAAAVGGVLVAAVGTVVRAVRIPLPAVLIAQAVMALGWLQWHFRDLGPLWRSVRDGAVAINTHEAPVPVEHVGTAPFLAVCALLLIVGLDLVAVGLSRSALAGLPLLLALTVPISTLDAPIPLALLLGAFATFVVLLALEHRGQADDWGRVVGQTRSHLLVPLVTALGAGAAVLGLTAAAVAPTGQGLQLNRGEGQGRGEISVSNPMVEIRRGLVNQSHQQMLRATTEGRTPRYLRLAVLDAFDGERWTPSPRDLPSDNRVGNGIPEAPGLRQSVPGHLQDYRLQYSEAFSSPWLVTPYPYRSVDIGGGDYRYDERTLDLFNTDEEVEPALDGYDIQGFAPAFTAEDLDSAGSAPTGIDEDMTALPDRMPGQVADIAADVVGDERTDYQRVVALQEWFRSSGGFRYSLWDGPPVSGSDALVGFLTTDRVGYCEQFATAMAVLARTIGVPARVAVGFGRPKDSSGNTYEFTGESLHAWTEIYFEGYGWIVFDPTPAVQSGPAPSYSEGIEEESRTAPSDTATPSAQPAPTRPERDPGSTGTDDDGGGLLSLWPAAVLLLVAVAGLAPRVWRGRLRRRRWAVLDDSDAGAGEIVRAAWQELRATSRDHGLAWQEDRSPRVTLTALRRQLDLDRPKAAKVSTLADVIGQVRYARDASLTPAQHEQLREGTRMLVTEIARQATASQRRRARWWPRDLLVPGQAQ